MIDELSRAEAERVRSRARFRASVAAARDRLDPAKLRVEGTQMAHEVFSTIPTRVLQSARKRPEIVAAAVTGVALWLFRKPIFGALKRLTQEKDNG